MGRGYILNQPWQYEIAESGNIMALIIQVNTLAIGFDSIRYVCRVLNISFVKQEDSVVSQAGISVAWIG